MLLSGSCAPMLMLALVNEGGGDARQMLMEVMEGMLADRVFCAWRLKVDSSTSNWVRRRMMAANHEVSPVVLRDSDEGSVSLNPSVLKMR